MKIVSVLFVVIYLLLTQTAIAQNAREPFTAIWDFNNSTTTGVSNKTAVVASGLGTVGVNVPGVQSIAYPASPPPGSGQYVNIQNWNKDAACTGAEYVEVTVSPQGGKDFTVSSVSFLVSSSASGPLKVFVTSSINGFNANSPLVTATLTQSSSASWQLVDIPLGSFPAYQNATVPITFRISACLATGSGSTLRIDNININGDIMLPADLVAFTAKADGRQVRLEWVTSWERNTDRFVAEVSTNLQQFWRVGEVAAAGTSDQRQLYILTDETPAPGPNYYRLQQLDWDGTAHYSKTIVAIVETDAATLLVIPNPADRQQIAFRVATTNLLDVTVFDMLGRPVAGRLAVLSNTDAAFVPNQSFASGRYWLRLNGPSGSSGIGVLVP